MSLGAPHSDFAKGPGCLKTVLDLELVLLGLELFCVLTPSLAIKFDSEHFTPYLKLSYSWLAGLCLHIKRLMRLELVIFSKNDTGWGGEWGGHCHQMSQGGVLSSKVSRTMVLNLW